MNDETMRALAALCKTATTLKVPQGDGVEWISLVNKRAEELVAALREARRGLAWVPIQHMPEAGEIIRKIDKIT